MSRCAASSTSTGRSDPNPCASERGSRGSTLAAVARACTGTNSRNFLMRWPRRPVSSPSRLQARSRASSSMPAGSTGSSWRGRSRGASATVTSGSSRGIGTRWTRSRGRPTWKRWPCRTCCTSTDCFSVTPRAAAGGSRPSRTSSCRTSAAIARCSSRRHRPRRRSSCSQTCSIGTDKPSPIRLHTRSCSSARSSSTSWRSIQSPTGTGGSRASSRPTRCFNRATQYRAT